MASITTPPKCPACGYDGVKDGRGGRTWVYGLSHTTESHTCVSCGVVWWEHALRQAQEQRDTLDRRYRDVVEARDKAWDELLAARGRIRELLDKLTAANLVLSQAWEREHDLRAGFMAYHTKTGLQPHGGGAIEAVRAAAQLCESTPPGEGESDA